MPSLPLANVQTMADYYGRAMERTALTLLLLGVTAGMALLLGLVGIYGVISYIVSLRVREIGIRLALGAPRRALRRMLMGRVLALVLGRTRARARRRRDARQADGVAGVRRHASRSGDLHAGRRDPRAHRYLRAAYLPARRITRIDPTSALRAD